MGIITTMLRQTATYWPPGGYDNYGGSIAGTPELILVRWEDKLQEYVTVEGEQKISNAYVYVPKDLEIGGWLYLGDFGVTDAVPAFIGFGVNERPNPDYVPPIPEAPKRATRFGKASMGLRSSREVRRKLRAPLSSFKSPEGVGDAQQPGTVGQGIYRIAQFEKTPNLKATQTLRVAIV